MVDLRVRTEHFEAIREHLRNARPSEEGAFGVVARVPRGRGQYDLVLREVILPRKDSWIRRGTDCLSPSTSYINRAATRAEDLGGGVAFIHSHPDPDHPIGFSLADLLSTEILFENLAQILPSQPMASLVASREGVVGLSFFNSMISDIDAIRVVGGRIDRIETGTDRDRSEDRLHSPPDNFDRQRMAIGKDGQDRLAKLRIAVVGAGGVGSSVIEQLARIGVRSLFLVDPDVMDTPGLSRCFGSRPEDAILSTPKVKIASRNVHSIAPDCRVRLAQASVSHPDVVASLAAVDLVFCCTDTDSSRATLNDVCYQWALPVLDVGCRVRLEGDGGSQMVGRVRYLRPGLPCLWCTETIDGNQILLESLPDDEREKRRTEGYGSGASAQPSLVSLTNTVASLAISEFLRIASHFGPAHDGSELFVELQEGIMTRAVNVVDQRCVCQTARIENPADGATGRAYWRPRRRARGNRAASTTRAGDSG